MATRSRSKSDSPVDRTLPAAIVAGLVVVGASALLRLATRYLLGALFGSILASGVAVGIAWIACDLLFRAYRPQPVRLTVVALGAAWFAWNVWRMTSLGATDDLIGNAGAGFILITASWQSFKGGDGADSVAIF